MTATSRKRPNRRELLRAFFPEEPTSGAGVGFGTKGDKEAADAINLRCCEAILTDLIGEFDKGLSENGRGVLVINLQTGAKNPHFYALADAEADYDQAFASGDIFQAKLKEVVSTINSHNPNQAALFLLIDNSRFQLLPVGRDYPATGIKHLMEEAQA
jgi:hypothetical protein